MAATPDRIVVHVDVRAADEELVQMFRRMVRVRPPVPPRRSLWRRLGRWWRGRR